MFQLIGILFYQGIHYKCVQNILLLYVMTYVHIHSNNTYNNIFCDVVLEQRYVFIQILVDE